MLRSSSLNFCMHNIICILKCIIFNFEIFHTDFCVTRQNVRDFFRSFDIRLIRLDSYNTHTFSKISIPLLCSRRLPSSCSLNFVSYYFSVEYSRRPHKVQMTVFVNSVAISMGCTRRVQLVPIVEVINKSHKDFRIQPHIVQFFKKNVLTIFWLLLLFERCKTTFNIFI